MDVDAGGCLSGCGRREREEAGRLFTYSSQPPPSARGPGQNIPARSLERAREMGGGEGGQDAQGKWEEGGRRMGF